MAPDKEKKWTANPVTWVAGGCCLGCLVLPLILMAVAGTGALLVFRGASGLTDEALERVRANPAAVAALGEPIEAGWQIHGSINVDGDGGEADYSVPVSGTFGQGRLYVVAQRQDGEWVYEVLILEVEGREEAIEILVPPSDPPLVESPQTESL